MGTFLTEDELRKLKPAQTHAFRSPVPTQIISNGEFDPLPQTAQQKQVEELIKERADRYARRLGLDRRQFLATGCGMAAAFLAMNQVYGTLFRVSEAEAAEPEAAEAWAESVRNQFIFDVQTHFCHDDYQTEELLGLLVFAKDNWNPALTDADIGLDYYKFENFVRQIFMHSDTSVALLSSAPFDDPAWTFLANDPLKEAVDIINAVAGSRRMLGHFVITPRQGDWMAEVDRAIEELKPASWKAYTIGDPLTATTRYPWRLDDEELMYPFYEKIVKAGITNLCIHKGLMPADFEQSWKEVWKYNTPWDVGQAAKDWPQINFIIYHGCMRAYLESPDIELKRFEDTGRLLWASDLADIPGEWGVSNVYAEMGSTFANSCTANPRLAAALLGTWIRGLGLDHVVWGTDSVLYGSPQWQIEALRRLEIPEEMQKKHGFAPLGPVDGKVKKQIFGLNSAALYDLDWRVHYGPLDADKFAAIREQYRASGGFRDNATYGYVAVG